MAQVALFDLVPVDLFEVGPHLDEEPGRQPDEAAVPLLLQPILKAKFNPVSIVKSEKR